VHEQRVERITDGRPADLGVVDDLESHLRIGGAIDIGMAHARARLDDGHRRVLDRHPDQPLSTSRNDHVEKFAKLQHPLHEGAVGGRDELHRRVRQAGGPEPFLNRRGDGPIGHQRLAAAPQHNGVAGLEANRRHVARDVRPRFVHNADDPQRYSPLRDPEPVRPN
jgi:hypothetical protein